MPDADDKLTPADPRDIVTALALGLTSGRQLAKYQGVGTMAKIVPERLVEHLSAVAETNADQTQAAHRLLHCRGRESSLGFVEVTERFTCCCYAARRSAR